MRGAVTAMAPESVLQRMVGVGATVCEVVVDEVKVCQLRCTQRGFKGRFDFQLIDDTGQVVDERSLQFRAGKASMDLGLPSHPLKYEIGVADKRFFVTREEKIPTFYKIKGNTQSLTVDGMKFEHHDYQSVLHFQCPKERFSQAAMMASLLFSPPIADS